MCGGPPFSIADHCAVDVRSVAAACDWCFSIWTECHRSLHGASTAAFEFWLLRD